MFCFLRLLLLIPFPSQSFSSTMNVWFDLETVQRTNQTKRALPGCQRFHQAGFLIGFRTGAVGAPSPRHLPLSRVSVCLWDAQSGFLWCFFRKLRLPCGKGKRENDECGNSPKDPVLLGFRGCSPSWKQAEPLKLGPERAQEQRVTVSQWS